MCKKYYVYGTNHVAKNCYNLRAKAILMSAGRIEMGAYLGQCFLHSHVTETVIYVTCCSGHFANTVPLHAFCQKCIPFSLSNAFKMSLIMKKYYDI